MYAQRYLAAAFALVVLATTACSGENGTPVPGPSGSGAVATSSKPAQAPRRNLPDLDPPTDKSVKAFSNVLMENTRSLKPEDRVRADDAFNVDPAQGTCSEADMSGVVSGESGRMAVKYCPDGRLIYSLDGLKRYAEQSDDKQADTAKSIILAFINYLTVKLYGYAGVDPYTIRATAENVKLAYCAHGYMYGGLIKGGYIGSEADLGWSAENAYAGNLSVQRMYRNARDNGMCVDPGDDGKAPSGDRANVEVPNPCGLVNAAALKRQTGADTKIPDTEGARPGRVCRLYYADTASPFGQEVTWEFIVTKLENNVAAMQLCSPGDSLNMGVKTYKRPGGAIQTVKVGRRIFTGSACVRNYVITLTVSMSGWNLAKMLAATDEVVTRINSYA